MKTTNVICSGAARTRQVASTTTDSRQVTSTSGTDTQMHASFSRQSDDETLVMGVKAGNHRAFELLFQRYAERVSRHFRSVAGSSVGVEDLVQDVFLRVFQKIHTYRCQSCFSTWLFRVTRNVAISHLRKQARQPRGGEFDEKRYRFESERYVGSAPTPLSHAIDKERVRVANRFLTKLSKRKMRVFLLYEIEGFTLEEIAEKVNSPVYTVASRLRNARQQIRRSSYRYRVREETVRRECLSGMPEGCALPYGGVDQRGHEATRVRVCA